MDDSMYGQLVRSDLIDLMKRVVGQGGAYRIRASDGKLEASHGMGVDSPWHHVKHMRQFHCDIWHQLLFNDISPGCPARFIPSGCMRCFKVVVRPRTVEELFQLLELQKRLDLPSKCGIEPRETVHGLYGGYFYNDGLAAGLECYTQIRAEIDEHIGSDVSVLLKRACTEFELAIGPSNEYKLYAWQIEIENLVDRWVAKDDTEWKQPELVLTHVHRRWIEWAYAHGDPTYAKFVEEPPDKPCVTSEHLVGASKEELRKFLGET